MSKKVAKFLVTYPKLVLLFGIAILILSGIGITKMQAGFGFKIWFAPNDPYLKAYEQYERDFGNDDSIIVAMYSPSGIFDQESVRLLKYLTDKMWTISDVIRVDSLDNYQLVSNNKGDIVIERIFPTDDPSLIAQRKDVVAKNETLISYLISRDLKTVTIHAQMKPLYDKQGLYVSAVHQVKDMLKNLPNKGDHEFHVAGSAAISTANRDISSQDMMQLTPLMFILVLLLLVYHFRSVAISSLLIVILGLTIFVAFGFAGWVDIRFNSMTSCLPQILIAMTLAEGIHFLGSFFRFRNQGYEKKEAVEESVVENFLPTFMTALTTVLGFITFCTSSLQPVRELGLLASFGIMLSWLLTLCLLPVFLLYLPSRIRPPSQEKKQQKSMRIHNYMKWVERHRVGIVISWVVIFVACVVYGSQNQINSDILNYFSKRSDIRQANDFMHEHFGGSRGIEIVFDSHEADGVKQIDFLEKVISFQDWVRSQKQVTKVTSIVDIIEELNRAMEDENEKHTRLPASNESVAQQLFLYSMSLPVGMGLNYWSTLDYQKMRMKILWDVEDSVIAEGHMNNFKDKAKSLGLDATITGKSALIPGMSHHIISTFNEANIEALILIAISMIIMFRSFSVGLLSMIPNIVPPAFAAAIMVLVGIKYDVGTILVMSVVMGIAVDDTIHFLSNYVDQKKSGLSTFDSMLAVFDKTGPSIMLTTVILVLGFGLSVLSKFMPFVNFGLMTGVSLGLALFADLMLLPAVLLCLENNKLHKKIFKT